jgi:hypothetical protein
MTASHLDRLGVVVEGAVDRFCGRPISANPYCATYAAEAHVGWRFGWQEDDFLLDIRAAEEAARWLQDAA